jgi:acyl CoA:acetate/3-ketoacid CoA transferase alpha subunit
MVDKRCTLAEAVSLVHDGASVTFSGFGHSLQPLAFCRELVRQGRRRLHLLTMGECWAADLLCGAGCVATVHLSCLLFEGYGRCQNFSRAVEEGTVAVEDYSHFAITSRFLAGALGVPFLPIRSLLGSDILTHWTLEPRKHVLMDSPFSGERVVLVPALQPDVAVIHASRADAEGNVQLVGPRSIIDEQARAARTVIATVEEVVDPAEIRRHPELTVVPGFLVEAVVEVPFGAHPTGMYRYYDYDEAHIAEYYAASRDPARFRAYLERYVYDLPDHWAYLDAIGLARLLALRADPHWGYVDPELRRAKEPEQGGS